MKTLLTIALVLPIASCGTSGTKKKTTAKGGSDAGSEALAERWQSNCIAPSNIAGTASNQIVYAYQGSQLLQEQTYFGDSACQTPTFLAKVLYDIKVVSFDISGLSKINKTVVSGNVTPSSEAATVQFNSLGAFGFGDWKTGVGKDITSLALLPGDESTVLAEKGQVFYQIAKKEASVLYEGKSPGGLSEAERPTEVDKTIPYQVEKK